MKRIKRKEYKAHGIEDGEGRYLANIKTRSWKRSKEKAMNED